MRARGASVGDAVVGMVAVWWFIFDRGAHDVVGA